jgi:predicted ATPase
LSDLSRDELVLRIPLQRFAVEETSALIGATLSDGEGVEARVDAISPQLSQLIYQRTEGNAFFTRQLTRALQEQGELQFAGGQWRLRVATLPTSELKLPTLPESIRAVIGQRLGRLAAHTQELLREASVLGQVFAFDELRLLGGRGEQVVEEALEEAVSAGIVREGPHDRYHFNHVLTRDTLYIELPARRRHRLHRRAAETIEGSPDHERRVAELAYH